MTGLGVSTGALALVVGFPLLLLLAIQVLATLEKWMLQPYERAVAIERLLAQEGEVEEVERAVARVLADVADVPARRPRPEPLEQSVS